MIIEIVKLLIIVIITWFTFWFLVDLITKL